MDTLEELFNELNNRFNSITVNIDSYNLKEYLEYLKDFQAEIDYEIGFVKRELNK